MTTEPFYIKVQGGVATRIKKVSGALVTNWMGENDNSGIIRFTPAKAAQEADPEHGIEAQEATNASFLVGNERGAALPNAGGPGTKMLYLMSITLISLAAGAGLLIKRRRGEAA